MPPLVVLFKFPGVAESSWLTQSISLKQVVLEMISQTDIKSRSNSRSDILKWGSHMTHSQLVLNSRECMLRRCIRLTVNSNNFSYSSPSCWAPTAPIYACVQRILALYIHIMYSNLVPSALPSQCLNPSHLLQQGFKITHGHILHIHPQASVQV